MTSEKDDREAARALGLPRDSRDEAKAGLRRMGIEPLPTPPLGLTKAGQERSRTTDPRLSRAPVLPSDLGLSVDFPGAMNDVARGSLTNASTPTPASWALFSDRSIASAPYHLIAPCLSRAFACDDEAARKAILCWALGLVDAREVERDAAVAIADAVGLERKLVPRDEAGRPALEEWWKATRAPGSAVLGVLTAVENDRRQRREANDVALFIDSRETPAQRACKLIEMRRLDRHDASVRIEPFVALADAIEEVAGASEASGTRALSDQALEKHTREVERIRPEVLESVLDEVERVKRVGEIDRRKKAADALAKQGPIAPSDAVILSPAIALLEPEIVSDVLVNLPPGKRDAMTRPDHIRVARPLSRAGEHAAHEAAALMPTTTEASLASVRDQDEVDSGPSSLDTMEPTAQSRVVRARNSRRKVVATLIGLASVVIVVSSWILLRGPEQRATGTADPAVSAVERPAPRNGSPTTAAPTVTPSTAPLPSTTVSSATPSPSAKSVSPIPSIPPTIRSAKPSAGSSGPGSEPERGSTGSGEFGWPM